MSRCLLATALALSSGMASAEEVSKQACVNSHVRAQSQRMDGQLVESQRSLRVCANKACPEIVQRDCVRWLQEIEGEVPTVIFEAFDQEGALKEVTVRHEGHVLATSMDGSAVEINPGTYEFRFETTGGRRKTLRVLVRQGDHNRHIVVDFSPADHRDRSWSIRLPPPARVSGGITLLAIATSAGFGASALLQQANVLDTCAPHCEERVSRRIERRAAIADIAGGVAVLSGAVTIAWVVRASTAERSPSAARVGPVLEASGESVFMSLKGAF